MDDGKKASPVHQQPAEAADGSAAQIDARESTSRRLRSARTRFRRNSHDLAHDLEDESPALHHPEHPLTPRGTGELVASQEELDRLIEDLRRPRPELGGEAGFAFDSEFIGESTYRPRLCLIQVATPSQICFIDPLAGVELAPFWELLGDAAIRKIVHAGEQDLEPVVRAGIEPANVIDTQVVAGFCALPYPTSLSKLVEHVVGVRLGKGVTFTQWDQRPLSKKQLAYAADDVRFLLALSAGLHERLGKSGLTGWAREECSRRARMAARNDSQEPWQKVRGLGSMSGQQLAIIRELAIWREHAAQSLDLPPRAVLRDELLIDLAKRPPAELGQLGRRHMPRPLAEQYGAEMMAAITRGRSGNPLPVAPRAPEGTLAEKFAGDAALALLQTIAVGRGIDPALLANRREVESFARLAGQGGVVDAHPLMQGWRREAAGELLLRLIASGGQAQLEWVEGRPVLRES